MDLSFYKQTELEQMINKTYIDNGIFYPEELEIDVASDIFKVDLQYYSDGPSFADYPEGEEPVIFLNAYGSERQRRSDFFHELGHPLLHVGDQSNMPKLFEQLQEAQAGQFQLYAAMPIYMIEPYIHECYTISALEKTLAEAFRLPESLVQRRILQIENRIYWERINQLQMLPTPKVKITAEHVKKVMEDWGLKREKEEMKRMMENA
jgi:Zn-dependent peptidase ImmA (M78 family)